MATLMIPILIGRYTSDLITAGTLEAVPSNLEAVVDDLPVAHISPFNTL